MEAETLELVLQNFKRRFHFSFLVSVAVDKHTQGETGWTKLKI